MKKLFFVSLLLIISLSGFAQQGASIKFAVQSHNFGTIAEVAGSVSYEFTFENVGDLPLVISKVTASCGCTTPNWTKEPIAPGKTGVIKATYNAAGRPGPFNKTITVFSNAKEGGVLLVIQGVVTPKSASVEDSYPFSISDLRLKNISLPFYDLSKKGEKSDKIEVYNSAKIPLKIRFDRVPSHMKIVANPETLQPGTKGEISVTYVGYAVKDWGARTDEIYLLINNETHIASDRKIVVSANLVEDFSMLTPEQRLNAPVIESSSLVSDFGVVKSGEEKTQTIILKNSGKTTLQIRKIKSDASFITLKLDRMSIPVGKSTILKITLNPTKLKRAINERITVISNDPTKPSLVIRVAGAL